MIATSQNETIPTLLAGAAVRVLGLGHIADVEQAIARLQMQADASAIAQLHHTLRRLQEVLRSFGRELESSISRKHVRELAALATHAHTAVHAHATSVFLNELNFTAETEEEGAQLRKLQQKLEKFSNNALRGVGGIAGEFEGLARRWRKSLGVYKLKLQPETLPHFENFTAVALREVARGATRLADSLESISDVDGRDALGKSRRSSERLYHVLEPLRGTSNAFNDASRALQQLSSLLTDIEAANALHKMMAAGDESTLQRMVEQKRGRLFFDLRRVWLEGNSKWLFQRLRNAVEFTSRMEAAR